MQALPGMQFTITEPFTPTGNTQNSLHDVWVNVQVSNVGLFSPLTPSEIISFLMSSQINTETFVMDQYYGTTCGTHAFSNKGLSAPALLGVGPVLTGSGAGLSTINFEVQVGSLWNNATHVRFRLIDEINRPGRGDYDMSQ